jgi:hypothetical protein
MSLRGFDPNCFTTTVLGSTPPHRRVVCREITVQNATVPTGGTLMLESANKVVINTGFKVETGGTFIIR